MRRKALKQKKIGIQPFLESGIHWAEIWNPVLGIRNPQGGIQNPRLSWIPLHGAKWTYSISVSISGIMISAPRIMKYQVQAIWNNSSNSHRLGARGRHRRRHGSVEGRCKTTYGSPERQKYILFERLFTRNKKINALTEVKEDQYLKEGVCISGRRINFL